MVFYTVADAIDSILMTTTMTMMMIGNMSAVNDALSLNLDLCRSVHLHYFSVYAICFTRKSHTQNGVKISKITKYIRPAWAKLRKNPTKRANMKKRIFDAVSHWHSSTQKRQQCVLCIVFDSGFFYRFQISCFVA